MNYEEARQLIQSGDVVLMGKDNSPISAWVAWWTGSPYSHAAIALRLYYLDHPDKYRIFVIEQHTGGQRIVNLSSYTTIKRQIDVIESPTDWNMYGEDLMDKCGSIAYAYEALVTIGLREKFGLKFSDTKGEVCSEMVAKVLKQQGVPLTSEHISPGVLYKELLNLGFKTRANIINKI